MSARLHRLWGDSTSPEYAEALRIAEALLFAASEPVRADDLALQLPAARDVDDVLADLQRFYAGRGINLVEIAGGWAFRTAPDLAGALAPAQPEPRKLSRAAMEVLAIIAYHQPVTRAEIEEIRGVSTSKGTVDILLEAGWVRLRGRRKTPGRPVTFGTTPGFLDHFGLNAITDLPGLDDLKGMGLIDRGLSGGSGIPVPDDTPLREDEDPLEPELASLGSADLGDE